MELKQLDTPELKSYCEHTNRLIIESSEGKGITFTDVTNLAPLDAAIEFNKKKWSTKAGELGWGRTWGHIYDKSIISNISLLSQGNAHNLHRASLGTGIELAYRGQGLGKNLMEIALHWAQEQDFLEYIDLTTYLHNSPAIALFKKFGFIEIGRKIDALRANSMQFDEISMTLKL